MKPVDDDIVDRYAAFAELCKRREYLLLGVVFLTALPIAHRPFRHHRSLTGQCAVAGDDVIHVVAIDEIIVNAVLHLTPPAHVHLLLRIAWVIHAKSAVSHRSVRFPLYLDGHPFTPLKIHREFIAVGIPCRAPTLRHHLLIVDIHFLIAGIIEYELIFTALLRLYCALVGDMATGEIEILRKIDHVGKIPSLQMLEIDGILTLHECGLRRVCRNVSACQGTLLTILVKQLEYSAELLVAVGITPAAK